MHIIRAFIAKADIIKKLADDWSKKPVILPQGFALVFLTDEFFEKIEASAGIGNSLENQFEFFTSSVARIMERYSVKSKLAYIETEYFGGVGGQGAVLYVDGNMTMVPEWEDGIGTVINKVLAELGVTKENDNDEFDSINLGHYRSMRE